MAFTWALAFPTSCSAWPGRWSVLQDVSCPDMESLWQPTSLGLWPFMHFTNPGKAMVGTEVRLQLVIEGELDSAAWSLDNVRRTQPLNRLHC